MTKYQYTYFIYPYVIDSNKYNKYLLSLLKNKKCKLKIFEKEKDVDVYQYFLPDIREYMFWSFSLDKRGIKSFESIDVYLKSNLLASRNCNIFEYELPQDLQGKIGEKEGIFFDINGIEIISYQTGICFLVLKTTLIGNKNFTDILNFNYKFREINSQTYELKKYENIHLQSDTFKDVQEISGLMKEITGNYMIKEKMNIDSERMVGYSYCCLDQNSWNEETDNIALDNMFEKYRMFLPANYQIADKQEEKEEVQLYQNKYVRYGVAENSTVLLTSDINPLNYTTVVQKYENEYLYTYILELYKKCLLKKLNSDFSKRKNFKEIEGKFLEFTEKLWIQEITNDEFGKALSNKWHGNLEIEEIFQKLKKEYDILYKRYNIEQTSEKNGKLATVVVITIVIGIINMILLLGKT